MQINGVHCSGSDTLEDFCDGNVYHSHPLFSLHSDALQVFFYYDDLEVCNPLGSRRKIHKISKSMFISMIIDPFVMCIGIFYFTLGNVRPKYRSKLSTIQLVAIVKHKYLSVYGMDAVLRPFVDDMKKLVLLLMASACIYCMGGNFYGVVFFVIFMVDLAVTKVSYCVRLRVCTLYRLHVHACTCTCT